ncbi:MAG: 23S rRNA (pseudouridine(1915)-N(3))-methyltransferase RlmH [Muribaculaceae bacterium]|nr:23S rRNA (pseudouridine(1915)-N(3))-methyltransferase RlmH [Muribaculaceae bacterium]
MEITVISVGKINSSWIQEGIQLFESRIKRYIKYSPIIIPDIRNSKSLSKETIKEEEGKLIMENLASSDIVVIMDEKGKEFTSRDFSEWIQKQMVGGRKRLVLVIGGPYGFSKAVADKADYKISLSKMTFTHEMAKLILTEQIYRAMTILRGEPYHHD